MEPLILLKKTEDVINTYEPRKKGVEAHADACLEKGFSEDEAQFVREVLYGVLRNKAALKVLMTRFLADNAGRVVRSDYTLYMILSYLCVFRLEELTLNEFQRLIMSIDPPEKTVTLLEYLFKELESSGIAAEWTRLYDPDHVHGVLLKNLKKVKPSIDTLIEEILAKSHGIALAREQQSEAEQKKYAPKKSTVPVAPKLTKANPRRLPPPQRITNATSKSQLRPPTPGDESQVLVEENESPRRPAVVAKKKKNTQVIPMRLSASRDPGALERARKEAEEKEKSELHFGANFKAQPAPDPPKSTVKLNTAAILREDALVRQRLAKEANEIRAYEAELRDSSEFDAWQNEMKTKDIQARLEQVQRARVLAKASAEEARQARLDFIQDNHELALRQAEETKAMNEERRLELELELCTNRETAKRVRSIRDTAPRQAQERIIAQRAEQGEELKRDLEEKLKVKKEQDEQRALALCDRVKRLQAEFHVKHSNLQTFDPTQSSGIGLLDEMSMIEMQERIRWNEIREEKAKERKRQLILDEKQKQAERVAKKLETIEHIRATKRHKNQEIRQQRSLLEQEQKAEQQQKEKCALNELMQQIHAKRTAMKDQRRMLAKEQQRRARNNLFLGASKSIREEKNKDELLKATQRIQREHEQAALQQAALENAVNTKHELQKNINHNRIRNAQRRLESARNQRLQQSKLEAQEQQKLEIQRKKNTYRSAKAQHRANMAAIADPYVTAINQDSIERARSHREALRRVSQRIMDTKTADLNSPDGGNGQNRASGAVTA